MKRRTLSRVALAACLIAVGSAQGQDRESRFDQGTDGWTVAGPGTATWVATGGNSGGYLRVERMGSGELYLVAPAAFHGDWGTTGDNHWQTWLTVNYEFLSGAPAQPRPIQITVSGPGGEATLTNLGAYFCPDGWFPVTPHTWTPVTGTLAGVFANVTDLRIRFGADAGLAVGEALGVDNIAFTNCAANCDGSTAEPTLNVSDFVCFVNRWASRDPYAAMEGLGCFAVQDFLTFQALYANGCTPR